MRLVGFLSLLIPVVTLFGQGSATSCCRMTISTPKSPTELQVVLQNVGRSSVSMSRYVATESDLRVDLTKPDGTHPDVTEHGKQVAKRSLSGSRLLNVVLKPGETALPLFLDLRNLYTLTSGTYVAMVSRDVIVGTKKTEIQGTITIKVP
jgi:hypothetical protein